MYIYRTYVSSLLWRAHRVSLIFTLAFFLSVAISLYRCFAACLCFFMCVCACVRTCLCRLVCVRCATTLQRSWLFNFWMSHVTCESVTSRVGESRHIWISHVTLAASENSWYQFCFDMGWLWWAGAWKLQVSFADSSLFDCALLQKRPIILRSLLIVATPYLHRSHVMCEWVVSCVNGSCHLSSVRSFVIPGLHWCGVATMSRRFKIIGLFWRI